jgi:hypothetical protein
LNGVPKTGLFEAKWLPKWFSHLNMYQTQLSGFQFMGTKMGAMYSNHMTWKTFFIIGLVQFSDDAVLGSHPVLNCPFLYQPNMLNCVCFRSEEVVGTVVPLVNGEVKSMGTPVVSITSGQSSAESSASGPGLISPGGHSVAAASQDGKQFTYAQVKTSAVRSVTI